LELGQQLGAVGNSIALGVRPIAASRRQTIREFHPMFRLAAALLLISSPVASHDARAAEAFTFTGAEQARPGGGVAGAGTLVTGFNANLEYGDGHRESVAGQCTARDNPPGAAFTRSGVCTAPGAYTMEFHCQAVGPGGSNCWGFLTGDLDGRHNGLTGLVTYQSGPEGVAGVGRWND
jgi:hypothetical protein